MRTQVNFILKILILSLAVSVLLKYGGSSLQIAPTSLNALIYGYDTNYSSSDRTFVAH